MSEQVEKFMKVFAEMEERDRENKKMAVQLSLAVLKDQKIDSVVFEYSGYGDSGGIDEGHVITGTVEPEDWHSGNYGDEVEPADEMKELLKGTPFSGELPKPFYVYSKIDNLWDLLVFLASYVTPSGFEINDGGQGVIVIDATNNEIRCEHGTNYTETNHESETLTPGDSDAEIPS